MWPSSWNPSSGSSEMYKKQSLQDARLYHVPHTHQPCSRSNRGNGNRWSHAKPSDLLRPPPPPNHAILILTNAFKTAIKENRIHILKGLSKQFLHQVDTNLEFFMYDHSALEACYQTANDIINSHSTTTADPPTLVQQPRASFKPPKLDTPAWSCKSADFYPWLSTILNRFNLTQAEDNVKVALSQNAILLASFLHYRFWFDELFHCLRCSSLRILFPSDNTDIF